MSDQSSRHHYAPLGPLHEMSPRLKSWYNKFARPLPDDTQHDGGEGGRNVVDVDASVETRAAVAGTSTQTRREIIHVGQDPEQDQEQDQGCQTMPVSKEWCHNLDDTSDSSELLLASRHERSQLSNPRDCHLHQMLQHHLRSCPPSMIQNDYIYAIIGRYFHPRSPFFLRILIEFKGQQQHAASSSSSSSNLPPSSSTFSSVTSTVAGDTCRSVLLCDPDKDPFMGFPSMVYD